MANKTQWGIKLDGKVGNRAQQEKDGIYNSMEKDGIYNSMEKDGIYNSMENKT